MTAETRASERDGGRLEQFSSLLARERDEGGGKEKRRGGRGRVEEHPTRHAGRAAADERCSKVYQCLEERTSFPRGSIKRAGATLRQPRARVKIYSSPRQVRRGSAIDSNLADTLEHLPKAVRGRDTQRVCVVARTSVTARRAVRSKSRVCSRRRHQLERGR